MHEELFSRNALKLGRIHWYLLKADSEMHSRRFREVVEDSPLPATKTEITEFGREVGQDEIHWWIFRREADIDELRRRTEHSRGAAQRLKEASSKLLSNPPEVYDDLVATLRNFADHHTSEIDIVHDYVAWLHSKDVLAPSVLFSFRVWGSTRLSDRSMRIEADTIDEEGPRKIERLTEIVVGLRQRGRYTLDSVRLDVEHETYETYANMDPEKMPSANPIRISRRRVLLQTSHEALREFATYCEFVRNSLQNVLVDIEKFVEQRDLMRSDPFWRRFIMTVTHSAQAESRLWDLKETLHMWHMRGGREKDEAELRFAERVASFANAQGGILIVGVSDSPRRVEGIGQNPQEIEHRLDYTSRVVAEYVDCNRDAIYFRQVSVEDENGSSQVCLVIVIAQADSVVAVKDKQGRYTYPVRQEVGLDRADVNDLKFQKIHIKSSNFDFIRELAQFAYDR